MDSTYPLILQWVWGFQTAIPPINISNQTDKKIFFAAGPFGICYDWISHKQQFLFGHKNDIVSIASTPDKRYLASADSGEDNTLIIWNSETRHMYHVVDYFSSEGVVSMCFSSDGSKLFTLSGQEPQELSMWDWKLKNQVPDFVYKYKSNAEFQVYITVHPVYNSHFVSNGKKTVHFFLKDENTFQTECLDVRNLYDQKAVKRIGDFTQTTFSPMSSLAATGTTKGFIVLWGRPLYGRKKPAVNSVDWFVMEPSHRVCIRILQAMETKCSISFLSSTDEYIIAGTGKSKLIYYDEEFSIKWMMEVSEGQVNYVSFTYKPKKGFKGVTKEDLDKKMVVSDNPLEENDFIICTSGGFVGYFSVGFKEVNQILWGTSHLIKSIAVHPVWPYLYLGDYNGGLQKWNFNTKELINKEVYEGSCSEIELMTVDCKGVYVACAMSNGNIVIFDAVCLSAKPFFIADEVIHKPLIMNFSPDSQQLLIIDATSYVTLYRLQLLVSLKVLQMLKKETIPSEQPFWSFGGKTRQHQGRIVDCIFNNTKNSKNLFFYTLGEDRYLVEYNITTSKGIDIEVSKRIILEKRPIPTCMMWHPLYELDTLLAILNDDGKMRIYDIVTEKIVRTVSLPMYGEPIKRILLKEQKKCLLTKEFPSCTDPEEIHQYIIFNCSHIVGLSKYPIDGNPNTSLGVESTPSGINTIVLNKDQRFLFTAGSQDAWIFMYEINLMALLEAEQAGGDGLDSFKYLFPANYDPDEMKEQLKYSVYSLELEMKMLEFGESEQPFLTGEIPISFLEYVLASLGCFTTPNDLQMMIKDIEFENKYKIDGVKTTLNCLDIMKRNELYINYRPTTPVTKSKLKSAFRDILSTEEDPDQMPRARFIDILSTRGDIVTPSELVEILKCLQNKPPDPEEELSDSSDDEQHKKDDDEPTHITTTDYASEAKLKKLVPEFVTEDILFQDILCLEHTDEDLSPYVLKKDDYKLVQEYPTLDDFVAACNESGF